jgi:hypothetical protein
MTDTPRYCSIHCLPHGDDGCPHCEATPPAAPPSPARRAPEADPEAPGGRPFGDHFGGSLEDE